MTATQVKHPWRSTVRTAVQGVVSFAPLAPLIYHEATDHDPAQATGAIAVALAVMAGVARVMANAQVEGFLQKWVPWLAAAPKPPT